MSSMLATIARRRLISTPLRQGARLAHTVPRAPPSQHYTLSERLTKFMPVEAYPLIAAVVCVSSFGLTYGLKAFTAVPGELRLVPSRLGGQEKRKEVWED